MGRKPTGCNRSASRPALPYALIFGLAAVAAHLDDLRVEPRDDIHEIRLLGHHLEDVLVDERHFVGTGADDVHALRGEILLDGSEVVLLKAAVRLIRRPAP